MSCVYKLGKEKRKHSRQRKETSSKTGKHFTKLDFEDSWGGSWGRGLVGDKSGEASWTQIVEGCAKKLGISPDNMESLQRILSKDNKVITLWFNICWPLFSLTALPV